MACANTAGPAGTAVGAEQPLGTTGGLPRNRADGAVRPTAAGVSIPIPRAAPRVVASSCAGRPAGRYWHSAAAHAGACATHASGAAAAARSQPAAAAAAARA